MTRNSQNNSTNESQKIPTYPRKNDTRFLTTEIILLLDVLLKHIQFYSQKLDYNNYPDSNEMEAAQNITAARSAISLVALWLETECEK